MHFPFLAMLWATHSNLVYYKKVTNEIDIKTSIADQKIGFGDLGACLNFFQSGSVPISWFKVDTGPQITCFYHLYDQIMTWEDSRNVCYHCL